MQFTPAIWVPPPSPRIGEPPESALIVRSIWNEPPPDRRLRLIRACAASFRNSRSSPRGRRAIMKRVDTNTTAGLPRAPAPTTLVDAVALHHSWNPSKIQPSHSDRLAIVYVPPVQSLPGRPQQRIGSDPAWAP